LLFSPGLTIHIELGSEQATGIYFELGVKI